MGNSYEEIDMDTASAAQLIAKQGHELGAAEVKLVEVKRGSELGAYVAVVPEGKKLESVAPLLEKWREFPRHKSGITQLTTLDSFIAFVKRHKEWRTAVFMDDSEPTKIALWSIFDAHEPNGLDGEPPAVSEDPKFATEPDMRTIVENEARWQKFRAVYSFPFSDEWLIWSRNKDWLTQAELARFLEDRILDVMGVSDIGPSTSEILTKLGVQPGGPSQLMALSKNLDINVDVKLKQTTNTHSGEGKIYFEETHDDGAGGAVSIPGAFVIAIPIFKFGKLYQVPVRLRYRATNQAVKFQLTTFNMEKLLEKSTNEASERVASETQVPVFRGRVPAAIEPPKDI